MRILRFFRFHARFGRGEPDAAAYAACIARANDLMALSRERIAAELLKLLASARPVAAKLSDWSRPRLPISGGDLIARGLEAGPVVAKTLGTIERDWIAAGFPEGAAFEAIVSRAMPARS